MDQEKIRIQPDGNIIVAPLGSVKASGKTIDELHKLWSRNISFTLKTLN